MSSPTETILDLFAQDNCCHGQVYKPKQRIVLLERIWDGKTTPNWATFSSTKVLGWYFGWASGLKNWLICQLPSDETGLLEHRMHFFTMQVAHGHPCYLSATEN